MNPLTDHRNALPTGYRLEDYQIQHLLGDGGFGITYLAHQVQLNTLVALKEYLPNELAVRKNDGYTVQPKSQKDTENFTWGLERFVIEAQTLAQFKHPNIVRVLHFFQANGTAYIVMEYEQGQNLATFLKDGETATEAEIMLFLPALLDGLAAVHSTGFLHRDIKPSNIYLRTKDSSPLLIDFGAARYDLSKRSRSITTIVTPGYAPFEQYQSDASQQGVWTDIYSLGAVLYRLISGRVPPEATERVAAVMRNKPDPLTPARQLGRGRYSRRFLRGIDWALTINEQERPQSVEQWRPQLLKSSLSRRVVRPRTGIILAVVTTVGIATMLGGWLFYDDLLSQYHRWLNQWDNYDSTTSEPNQMIASPPENFSSTESPELATSAPSPSTPTPRSNLPPTATTNPQAQGIHGMSPSLPPATTVSVSSQTAQETQLRTAAQQRARAATAKLPKGQLRITTGAGVRLRQTPGYQAPKGAILPIGTVVAPLEKIRQNREEWYRIKTSNGNQGWVSAKYTKGFNTLQAGQTYVEIAQHKLNDSHNGFGDLVDLYNFLQRVSEEVELEKAAELKFLSLLTLRQSLTQIPSHPPLTAVYQDWLTRHHTDIEKINLGWRVKKQRFQELYEKYQFLPIAANIQAVLKQF